MYRRIRSAEPEMQYHEHVKKRICEVCIERIGRDSGRSLPRVSIYRPFAHTNTLVVNGSFLKLSCFSLKLSAYEQAEPELH
jgi:hypothetical protein